MMIGIGTSAQAVLFTPQSRLQYDPDVPFSYLKRQSLVIMPLQE